MAVVERNAEVVREAFKRWAADDFTSVLELYAPEVTMDTGGVILAGGIHRGREQVSAALVDLAARQPVRSARTLELEENGDWVLAVTEFEDGFRNAVLFRLHDGLISQIEGLPTVEEARRRLSVLVEGEPVEPLWAPIGAGDFVAGHLEVTSKTATLCVGDTQIVTPLPPAFVDRVAPGDPVLAYLDDERGLLGWYLPEQQLGVDLREDQGPA